MKSIRLSLILYFLLLLAVALGAVSVFVYWNTAQMVQARKQSSRDLIQARYADRVRAEKDLLDEALLSQARTIAGLVQTQSQWNRIRYHGLYPLGLLSGALSPYGYLNAPVWIAEGVRSPLSFRMHRMSAIEVQFPEDEVPSLLEGEGAEHYQINGEWGTTWRSPSLENRAFAFDPAAFARAPLFDWKFDNVELSGTALRRVILKAPVSRYRVVHTWPPPRAQGPPGSRPRFPIRPLAPEPERPERTSFTEGASPTIYIQCAAETTQRDAAVAKLLEAQAGELAQLDTDAQAALVSLRNRLLGLCAVTFIATVAGGYLLVWLGLAPLRKVSDAVSQVSERDFRLPLDPRRLPAELRPIVERLTQTLDLLQRAFTREKQAAADISHELRTPLAALMTTLDVALKKPRSSEEYRELLADSRKLVQQITQLVERLLALARLDAGVDQLRLQEVDLAELTEQCAAVVRPLAQARELALEVHCPEAAPLTADRDKLREVITNLLHNAIEYNRPRGSVALKVERDNGHLHVEVKDTGIGIDPEARALIFERFYRADPSREAVGLHAGLGLAIVKGYVDLMGGRIGVESQQGQGSTFRVELPG